MYIVVYHLKTRTANVRSEKSGGITELEFNLGIRNLGIISHHETFAINKALDCDYEVLNHFEWEDFIRDLNPDEQDDVPSNKFISTVSKPDKWDAERVIY